MGTAIVVCLAVLAVLSAALVMFLDIRDAERRCADARVEGQVLAGKLAIATANTETQRQRAIEAERQAQAWEDEVNETHPDPAGARERMLAKYAATRHDATTATASNGVIALPPPPPPGTAHDLGDSLLKPGD